MILINFVLTDLKLSGCRQSVNLNFSVFIYHKHTPMKFDYLQKTLPRDFPTRNAVVVFSNKLSYFNRLNAFFTLYCHVLGVTALICHQTVLAFQNTAFWPRTRYICQQDITNAPNKMSCTDCGSIITAKQRKLQ